MGNLQTANSCPRNVSPRSREAGPGFFDVREAGGSSSPPPQQALGLGGLCGVLGDKFLHAWRLSHFQSSSPIYRHLQVALSNPVPLSTSTPPQLQPHTCRAPPRVPQRAVPLVLRGSACSIRRFSSFLVNREDSRCPLAEQRHEVRSGVNVTGELGSVRG